MKKKYIIIGIISVIIIIIAIVLVNDDNKDSIQSLSQQVEESIADCVSNTNPVFLYDITDLSLIDYIVPPGNLEDYEDYQVFKTHSYIKGQNVVPVYAPIDSILYKGVYITEEGINQYSLFFEISCEMYYIFDHIVDVRRDIKEAFSDMPTTKTNIVNTKERIKVKAGDLIGYSIGEQFDQWDFGVYDISEKNFLKDITDIPDLHERDYYARCPYDYYPEDQRKIYYDLFANHIDEPIPTNFCNSRTDTEESYGKLFNEETIIQPINEFKERITKKPFGIFITPADSPVQPERFAGYHTGVDVEYDDVTGEVPVRAIASGTVVTSQTASGYGGVVIIKHQINGENVPTIYGHLNPNSLPKVDSEVAQGQQIGVLGEGGTSETDGERKHLHFGMMKQNNVSLSGYVSNESDLELWYDPLIFY